MLKREQIKTHGWRSIVELRVIIYCNGIKTTKIIKMIVNMSYSYPLFYENILVIFIIS